MLCLDLKQSVETPTQEIQRNTAPASTRIYIHQQTTKSCARLGNTKPSLNRDMSSASRCSHVRSLKPCMSTDEASCTSNDPKPNPYHPRQVLRLISPLSKAIYRRVVTVDGSWQYAAPYSLCSDESVSTIAASILFDLLQSAFLAIAVLVVPGDSGTSSQKQTSMELGSFFDAASVRAERHPDSDSVHLCGKHHPAESAQMPQSPGGEKRRRRPEALKSTPWAVLTALRPPICSGQVLVREH